MKQLLSNHLKNVSGWKTNRKILAFAVDDYGNVRLHNNRAKENLVKGGVMLKGRFDHLDALDTREDYEMLFEVLNSVKDVNEKPAIFTSYALPCNTDYSATLTHGVYQPEDLDVTYGKLALSDVAYQGALKMLKEGIERGYLFSLNLARHV